MYDTLLVRSKLREYSVEFVESFKIPLKEHVDSGSFVVCDTNIFRIYEADITPLVPRERLILVESNERNKTLDSCKQLIELLVEKGVRRNNTLVAVGGGVIEDLTAFTASIISRGIEWVFIPTTVLAQSDSCIGSKTSINLSDKKNLVGTFYPPAAVYIDERFLTSLPIDDIKSGIGEIMHYYLYANSPMLHNLTDEYRELIENPTLLRKHIKESLTIKRQVIEVDEFDQGERQKFNYGHTFGHALESLTGYEINHGQAVTVGMGLANYISLCAGILEESGYETSHSFLAVNFPLYEWSRLDLKLYIELLSADKKNTGNGLTCILSAGPGRLMKRRIPFDAKLTKAISRFFSSIGSNNAAPIIEAPELLHTEQAD